MPSELLLNISFKSFFHACRASSLVLHTDKPDAAPHLPRGAPHGPRMPPAPAASLPLLLLVTEPSWNRDQNSYFIKYIRSVVNPDPFSGGVHRLCTSTCCKSSTGPWRTRWSGKSPGTGNAHRIIMPCPGGINAYRYRGVSMSSEWDLTASLVV